MDSVELISLIDRIKSAAESEGEIGALINVFVNSVSDPKAIDYIFEKKYEDLSSEEIADRILSYTATEL